MWSALERGSAVSGALDSLRTPCYVVDRAILRSNLEIMAAIREKTGCGILLALKGFAMWSLFPEIGRYLDGASASSLHEARLAREQLDLEVHAYLPAYRDDEFKLILDYADHLIFNSLGQWNKFRSRVKSHAKKISCGMRINPEHSEVEVQLYDPCAPGSRLGILANELVGANLDGIDGLHFHNLCELNSDALGRTLETVESRFGKYLEQMKWINLGGGHLITRQDYNIDLLCELVSSLRQRYNAKVYLEPGEAVALNAGLLIVSVLDIVSNEIETAILDTSATAHMPDVIEMPYRPAIVGAGEPGQYAFTYRLGGLSCLAGDVVGDYSFPAPLKIGDRLTFLDMAHYTMVKNTMFNGLRLPDIVIYDPADDSAQVVREFGYEDYKGRLS
ncbi:carboxynorspermidine decarboxylase [Gemmatimonadota bacterium]